MKTALTIAGSDSSGGAGIQADLKTMTVLGVFGMSALTALTAQNTLGVNAIVEVAPSFLEQQIEAVVSDIFPDATKTGMIASPALIEVIAHAVRRYRLPNLVVDPVMVATSGARLISLEAIELLKSKLLPLANLITPNIPEAEVLAGIKVDSAEAMERAAKLLFERYGCAVLIKGGHSPNDANDFLFSSFGERWFYSERIQNPNAHGTGCTFSAAIASMLAKGNSLEESIERGKAFLSGALKAMLDLGKGKGPLLHSWNLNE